MLLIVIIGCSDKSTNNDNNNVTIPDNIFPMKVGNEWTYIQKHMNGKQRPYDVRIIKDTIVNSEKWYQMEIRVTEDIEGLGDWGPDLFSNIVTYEEPLYRYFVQRKDGIYLGGYKDEHIWVEFLYFYFFDDSNINSVFRFTGQLSITYNNTEHKAYIFKCIPSYGKDTCIYYLIPNIGILKYEAINDSIVYGVFDITSYIIK